MGCGSSSHCRSTGEKVPFCGHYVPDHRFEAAMDGIPSADTVESLDGRDVLTASDRPPIPCLDGLLAVCEDRDGFELELARLAHERSLPCLGICRGMQVMNVALGGSLYRDLYNCGVTEEQHRQQPPYCELCHTVTIAQGSLLESVVGTAGTFEVNSMHHQGIDHVATGLLVSARASDRVVEAVEDPSRRFYLGVQWHPEYLDRHRGLFSALVDAAR